MRVAVVGPTHPFKGGVAAHTTELARHLMAAGHETDLVSWSNLYPARLYPGEQVVPDGVPDVAPFARTTRPLSWARPDTWVRTGQRLRTYDLVVLVHVVAAVVPAQLALLRAMRGSPSSAPSASPSVGPTVVVIAHNVLPHEAHAGSGALVRALFGRADAVLVHSDPQAREARGHGARRVAVSALPPHLPGGAPVERAAHEGPLRLLALGMVRPYKGIDVLLEALSRVPRPTLTVAGELWGAAGERIRELVELPALTGRVELRSGYLPAPAIPAMLAAHDVLVLPYRSATGSQNATLAFHHGLPVVATRTGTFAAEVQDGVNGLLANPGSVESLAQALQRLGEPGVLDKLRQGVRAPDLEGPWTAYLSTLLALAQRPASAAGPLSAALPSVQTAAPSGVHAAPGAGVQTAAPPGGLALAVAKRVAERVVWARVAIQRRTEAQLPAALQRLVPARGVPTSVPPSDVLRTVAAWQAAVAEAGRLRLPLHHDRPKNWDALGAVAAILSLVDDGTRSARVLDAGSARYSPVLPWLRLYGFGDQPESLLGINLEFGAPQVRDGVTFRYGDITATDLGNGALDAITCMSVIEHGVPIVAFLAESARVLRPGGILVVSTDYDLNPPDTTGRFAYGEPVRIFGPSDIGELVAVAEAHGLAVVGDLERPGFFEHAERPVHWDRVGLDYTFVLLTFRRR